METRKRFSGAGPEERLTGQEKARRPRTAVYPGLLLHTVVVTLQTCVWPCEGTRLKAEASEEARQLYKARRTAEVEKGAGPAF